MNRKAIAVVTVACALLVAMSTMTATTMIVTTAAAHPSPDKKDKSQGRLVFGKVLDPQDNPLADSVVYLTNLRTRAVKTYIVGQDGTYRFPALSTSLDYEVYAQ